MLQVPTCNSCWWSWVQFIKLSGSAYVSDWWLNQELIECVYGCLHYTFPKANQASYCIPVTPAHRVTNSGPLLMRGLRTQ